MLILANISHKLSYQTKEGFDKIPEQIEHLTFLRGDNPGLISIHRHILKNRFEDDQRLDATS